jgi:hypothetical protein
MPELNAPLQAQRDQQPYRDRGQMNKKITPAKDRFMRRMHFDHWVSSPVCGTA